MTTLTRTFFKIKSFFIFLLFVNFLLSNTAAAQDKNSMQGDFEALKEIYQALGGPNWTNNKGWESDNPATMGSWFGVITDGNGRVTHLDLQTGEPYSSGEGTDGKGNNLSNGDSNGNVIAGREFPESIGNLKKLKYLNLKQNSIRGPIPKNITQLVSAERILLSGHPREPDPGSETKVPYNHPVSSSSGKRSQGTNYWTGSIPENVGNLQNLVVWELSQTGVSGSIPPQFGQLKNLEMLMLNAMRNGNPVSEDQLTGSIPPELGGASSLRYLYLEYQGLSGSIPKELGKLKDLKMLRLKDAGLSGSIPSELGDISDLRLVLLHKNSLTGGFPSFFLKGNGHNSSLHTLRMEWNNLSGELPKDIDPSDYSSLGVLSIGGNNFEGSIPEWVPHLKLIQLNFDRNSFSGELPDGFHDSNSKLYRRLRNMKLARNNLTGPLPNANLGPDVYLVYLENNEFTGGIPEVWSEIKTDRDLNINVSGNNLSGTISPKLATIPNLSDLNISRNKFTNTDMQPLIDAVPNGVNFSYNSQSSDDSGGDDGKSTGDEGSGDEPEIPELHSPHHESKAEMLAPVFKWSDTGADSYVLHYSQSDPAGEVVDVIVSKNEYTLPDSLPSETTFQWRVHGVYDGVPGEWSDMWEFTTRAHAHDNEGSNLAAPVQLFPEDRSVNNSRFPKIEWEEVEGADYYILHGDRTNPYDFTINITTEQTSYIPDQPLDPEIKYTWRVRAVKDTTKGEWSEIWRFTTGNEEEGVVDIAPPYLVAPVNHSVHESMTPLFVWESVNADHYVISLIKDNAGNRETDKDMAKQTVVIQEETTETHYSPEFSLEPETLYLWKVKAVKDGESGEWSDLWEVQTPPENQEGVSIDPEEHPHTNSLKQNYPNPFNPTTQIEFTLSEVQNVSLRVYDMAGRQVATLVDGVKRAGRHTTTFSADNLASGVYIYRFVSETTQFTKKMTLVK